MSSTHILTYKPICPDTFAANKNEDVDLWLFSIQQYAEIVDIPAQKMVQFAATLL